MPKDPTLLAIGGRQFGGNTRPLLEACADFGFRGVWLTSRPEILALGRDDVVDAASFRGAWIAARAGAFLFTHALSDFGPLQVLWSRTKYYNLYHAMVIKNVSTQDPGFATRSYARSNLREMRHWSAMFVTGELMRGVFARTFGLRPERIVITGQPRTDALFVAAPYDLDAHYHPPLPPHTRRILYCPTYREFEPARLFPFDDRDDAALQALLARHDAVMYVRVHPNDPAGLRERMGRIVPMQGDVVAEVTDALTRFDVLVTDYSSIFYDFLFLDRPCIFLPYDRETYEQSPGFAVPYDEFAAGPRPRTQAEFAAALERALTAPDAQAEARRRVRDRVFDHVDGDSAARVLAFLRDDV